MSYVNVVPDALAAAAAEVSAIGSSLNAAHAAAALPTTAMAAAGLDEVSAAVTSAFSQFGAEFQASGTAATAFGDQFAQALTQAEAAFLAAETNATAALQSATASLQSADFGSFGWHGRLFRLTIFR